MKVELSSLILKNTQISYFIKIRLAVAQLLHAGERTEKHDKANTHLPQFCERSLKKGGGETCRGPYGCSVI
jgi:hypothetical protein